MVLHAVELPMGYSARATKKSTQMSQIAPELPLWKLCKVPACITEEKAFARRTDPQTSKDAAKSIDDSRLSHMEQVVLSALKRHPHGLTSHDLVLETGETWNTVTPRIRPLVKKGKVYDSGERRLGPAGRNCIVWKATI